MRRHIFLTESPHLTHLSVFLIHKVLDDLTEQKQMGRDQSVLRPWTHMLTKVFRRDLPHTTTPPPKEILVTWC